MVSDLVFIDIAPVTNGANGNGLCVVIECIQNSYWPCVKASNALEAALEGFS